MTWLVEVYIKKEGARGEQRVGKEEGTMEKEYRKKGRWMSM